jgi:hypothetical protein
LAHVRHALRSPPRRPVLGQDDDYVYGELLVMSVDQIADLKARQVVY